MNIFNLLVSIVFAVTLNYHSYAKSASEAIDEYAESIHKDRSVSQPYKISDVENIYDIATGVKRNTIDFKRSATLAERQHVIKGLFESVCVQGEDSFKNIVLQRKVYAPLNNHIMALYIYNLAAYNMHKSRNYNWTAEDLVNSLKNTFDTNLSNTSISSELQNDFKSFILLKNTIFVDIKEYFNCFRAAYFNSHKDMPDINQEFLSIPSVVTPKINHTRYAFTNIKNDNINRSGSELIKENNDSTIPNVLQSREIQTRNTNNRFNKTDAEDFDTAKTRYTPDQVFIKHNGNRPETDDPVILRMSDFDFDPYKEFNGQYWPGYSSVAEGPCVVKYIDLKTGQTVFQMQTNVNLLRTHESMRTEQQALGLQNFNNKFYDQLSKNGFNVTQTQTYDNGIIRWHAQASKITSTSFSSHSHNTNFNFFKF